MSGYRLASKWNDTNELRCLLALRQLQEKDFPRNLLTEIAKGIATTSGLKVGSVKAKIGNYKSVSGVNGPSNASLKTISTYNKYKHLNSVELQAIINTYPS